jgi:oligopeptide/dipeptide ABC transporter ATP-binding protein
VDWTRAHRPCPDEPRLLEIDHLQITFEGRQRIVGVRDATLSVSAGMIVGLVGESGSGKSLTCRAINRLIPRPGKITAGRVIFAGRDVLAMSGRELRALRARDVAMIFQDPFSALNPTMRVGKQIAETLRVNLGLSRSQANTRAIELLDQVDIPEPRKRFSAYPHELSGGMRQRVMIALAIAPGPKLLIADEPTTALDVTTQAQILKLIVRLRDETGMAVLFVSHDISVIAQTCDVVDVMYGGYVVESGPLASVLGEPQHPYTRALLQSIPSIENAGRQRRRTGIPGRPPERGEELPGCPFAPRCRHSSDACAAVPMTLESIAPEHHTACPMMRFGAAGERPGCEDRKEALR